MPSPRADRGRDFTAAPALQFDQVDTHKASYQRNLRNRKREADVKQARVRTTNGYAVEVRNGYPVHDYTYRGLGHDILEELLGEGYERAGHWSHDITWEEQRRA